MVDAVAASSQASAARWTYQRTGARKPGGDHYEELSLD